MLDPVHNTALRLCLGAFRTSPSSSLCVLSNEPPLYIRRRKLSIQYCSKLSSATGNPAYRSVFEPTFKIYFKFSTTKTVCVHFCCLLKAHPDPHLLLNGTPIPVVEQTQFLGLIFDKKNSHSYLTYNILKVSPLKP